MFHRYCLAACAPYSIQRHVSAPDLRAQCMPALLRKTARQAATVISKEGTNALDQVVLEQETVSIPDQNAGHFKMPGALRQSNQIVNKGDAGQAAGLQNCKRCGPGIGWQADRGGAKQVQGERGANTFGATPTILVDVIPAHLQIIEQCLVSNKALGF